MALVSSRLRIGVAFVLCLTAAACSGDGAVPLEDVGSSSSSSSSKLAVPLAPIGATVTAVSYDAPAQPVQTASRGFDYIDTPNLAGVGGNQPVAASVASSSAPAPAAAAATSTDEINMDAQFGFSRPAGPAQVQRLDIAEGNVDEPVVDGIGTGRLTAVGQSDGAMTRQSMPGTGAGDQQVAMLPRMNDPLVIPQNTAGQMPASEVSCRRELSRIGVRFTDIPAIHDSPQCGIDYPIEVEAIGDAKILPAAKLNCSMALTFARWVRNDLVPTARTRYFSGVRAIKQLSSYSCRRMNSNPGNPWSEHAHGNAIDIGSIILNSGNEVDVRKPGFFDFRQKGLLNTVRADSCKYFNTVLGPGDPYHGNHFHFDLRSRKSGRRYCSLD